MPPALLSQEEFEAQAKKAADKQLTVVQKAAAAAGVACESDWVITVAPWEAIIEAARARPRQKSLRFLLWPHRQRAS